MAPKIQRFTCAGKGNGLRATAGIRTGELVYSAEPMACCVSNKMVRDICHHCFRRCQSLLRCSQCKTARYCDVTCQKAAWPNHKKECKCLRSLVPRIPSDSVRLAARIILSMMDPAKSANLSEELYTFGEHQSHLSDMGEEKREGLSHLCSMLQLYLQPEVTNLAQEMTSALPPSCNDPLSVIAKVTCNCFTISDGELQEIGVGLYPSLSLLNHDCRPNCVMVFDGTKLKLRAVRDISPGEELTICYIESVSPSTERQNQLMEQYHFICRCQRCNTEDMDSAMISGNEAAWGSFKTAIPTLEKLQKESDWQGVSDACSSLLRADSGAVPAENVYKLRVMDMAMDASIHLGQWDQALGCGTKTLQPYRQYYPDPHPAHGVQLMRVGKLQHYLGQVQTAADTLRKAHDIIKVTHGPDHPLMTELRRKLEDCHTEMDCC